MNWDRVEGNWKQFTGKVKEQWGKLTDDDITVISGKQEQLVGQASRSATASPRMRRRSRSRPGPADFRLSLSAAHRGWLRAWLPFGLALPRS